MPTSNAVIPIRNYKGQLPYGFYKLITAIGCFEYTVTSDPDYNNPKLYDVAEDKIQNYLISKPSITTKDQDGENFYIIQKFEEFSVQYTNYTSLTVSKSSHPHCTTNCFNKQPGRAEQIEIQKSQGLLLANFEKGSVYIEYLQTLEMSTDEGMELLIPNFEQIKKWIKDYCTVELFRYLYNNTTLDIQGRLATAKQEETISKTNAQDFVKRFEFTDLYALRKLFASRYEKFNQIVSGPKPYTRHTRIYGK